MRLKHMNIIDYIGRSDEYELIYYPKEKYQLLSHDNGQKKMFTRKKVKKLTVEEYTNILLTENSDFIRSIGFDSFVHTGNSEPVNEINLSSKIIVSGNSYENLEKRIRLVGRGAFQKSLKNSKIIQPKEHMYFEYIATGDLEPEPRFIPGWISYHVFSIHYFPPLRKGVDLTKVKDLVKECVLEEDTGWHGLQIKYGTELANQFDIPEWEGLDVNGDEITYDI